MTLKEHILYWGKKYGLDGKEKAFFNFARMIILNHFSIEELKEYLGSNIEE